LTALLELVNVSLSGPRGDRLRSISLSVFEGERIALLGRSGAGKSTLLAIANGSLRVDKGEVRWRGASIRTMPRRNKREIGMLWQDLLLVEELSVGQNVNSGALGRHNLIWGLANLLFNVDQSACKHCLQRAGLDADLIERGLIDAPIRQLSGGQRQRVALARLLRQQSQLILADEPIANLDPAIASDLLDHLLNRSPEGPLNCGAKAIVISLHQPELVQRFDRVIGLQDGELVMDQPSEQLTAADLSRLYEAG
jgi:phosphonate transport system ATP-binding protein